MHTYLLSCPLVLGYFCFLADLVTYFTRYFAAQFLLLFYLLTYLELPYLLTYLFLRSR